MDPILKKLIDDCALMEGKYSDYYDNHGKCCITQTGALKIQRKCGIELDTPTIQTAGNRVVVHGHGRLGDKRHWTTGEGNPMGKAVEGSHPVAMAEKRWRVRTILGLVLDPEIQAKVYGADEFEPEGSASSQVQVAQPVATAAPANPHQVTQGIDPSELVESWGGLMGAISEMTGLERNVFENDILHDCSKFSGKNGWVAAPVADFSALAHKMNKEGEVGKWGRATLGKLRTLIKQLDEGGEYQTSVASDGNLRETVMLTKRKAGEPPVMPDPLDDDDIPF